MAERIPPNDRRCTANSRSTGKRCKQTRFKGSPTCRFHGGAGAEANVTHGRNRKIKPTPLPFLSELVKEVKAIWKDPKSLRIELEHLRAIYLSRTRAIEREGTAMLRGTDEDVVKAKIEELKRFADIGRAMQAGETIDQDTKDYIDSFRLVEDLSERDAKALASLIDVASKTVERMCKIEDGLKVTVSMPEMAGIVSDLKKTIRKVVSEVVDEKTAKAISKVLNDEFRILSIRGRDSA